jgi:hypothetical protein
MPSLLRQESQGWGEPVVGEEKLVIQRRGRTFNEDVHKITPERMSIKFTPKSQEP